MGGLGNQLFQYATAKRLATINDTELRIDNSKFAKLTANKEHTLQLEHFNVAAQKASNSEIRQLLKPANPLSRIAKLVTKRFRALPPTLGNETLYQEPEGSHFKPEVLKLEQDKYLIGYFNSYKYFDPIKNILVREYTPKEEISSEGKKVLELIESTNSVSIHIRRGDYVADPEVYKCIEGIITDRFYHNAVDHIAARVKDPHFFVFSNDMRWVKENLRIPYELTYVDINPPQRGFEDLWLMSQCKHNITAGGSTFSWWAAYLNPNPDKIVVVTENVSNDPKYNHPEDYFPQEWVRVKS